MPAKLKWYLNFGRCLLKITPKWLNQEISEYDYIVRAFLQYIRNLFT